MSSASPAFVLCAALALLPAARAEGDPPAEKPAALVHGRPLSRAAVHESLARRFLRGPSGDRLLDQYLLEIVARSEQEKRGVTVSEEEVAAAIADARRQMTEQLARRGEKVKDEESLDRYLKEAGFTLEDLRSQTRHYLALQKMAQKDLGAKGTVPPAQIEVWLRDLLRVWKVSADPASLPKDAVALLGDRPLTFTEAGRWLARNVRRHELLGAVYDLAFSVVVEERAARESVTLSEEEVAAGVYRRRLAFLREPGIEGTGVTFENWLRENTGMGVEELRKDPSFRSNLLARKVVAAAIPAEKVLKEWTDNPERYGETARIRRILVRGEERTSVFGSSSRPMGEARAMADRALEEIRGGKEFDAVARKDSEDAPPEGPRGQPVEVTPNPANSLIPKPVLDAVFRAKAGELLGPLKAVDGWHLVLVERRVPAPTFDEAKERVRDDLVAAEVLTFRMALRNDPEIVVADDL